jgi:hypothetical protein
MNDMIDTASDLSVPYLCGHHRNHDSLSNRPSRTPEAMDDIRVQDELSATVAELPVTTEEQLAR